VVVTVFILHNVIINKGVFIHNPSENYDTLEEWFFYILITITIPFLFNLSKESKFDNWIGQLSYPIYIISGLTIGVIINFTGYKILTKEILIIISTILFSLALVYAIEKPIEKFRKMPKLPIKNLSG
jgi:peptidoglycan/LPS O-acetylase OafA/YrhL